MAYKVLGQSAPSATTATDLYTVPTGKSAVGSTLSVCNRGSGTTYRVAVRPAGATLANVHYLVYDATLPANSTDLITIGMTLGVGDVVTIYAGAATLSFALFGSES
jgi:hypothetical protein